MSTTAPLVAIDAARRLVVVQGGTLACHDQAGRELVGRLFTCPEVGRVDVRSRPERLEIHLDDGIAPDADVLRRLGAALRDARRVAVPLDACSQSRGSVRRIGGRLTTWRVDVEGGDRLRFAHPRMRRDRVLARRVERWALASPGVVDARLGGWNSDLVLRFEPGRFDGDALLERLQHEVDGLAASPPACSPLQMLPSSTSLAVAATADLAISALAPVSAVLLVGTNLRTLRAAVGELRQRRVGMSTVAGAIVIGTLATGQFLASGIMAWSFDFWRRRHRRDVEAERLLLLDEVVPLPPLRIADEPRGHLLPGAEVPLREGDVVPADGRVVLGAGVVDDSAVSGIAGVHAVRPGVPVAAGAVLLGGRITLAVERPPEDSRVTTIGRLLAEATTWRPGRIAPTRQAEAFGEGFVGPTLATAGLGLLAGDVTTAVAVMRPDYASAEAITVSFEDLDAVARGLVDGFLMSRPGALDALASCDTLVIVDHPGLRQCRLEVSRVVSPVMTDDTLGSDGQLEAVRWAASLAVHIADERREALATLAVARGCALIDVTPESFGDAAGVCIGHRRGRRVIALRDLADDEGMTSALVLEWDGRPVATFEFARGAERRATAAIERIKEEHGVRVLLASHEVDVVADLAAELRCDGVLAAEPTLDAALATLIRDGRRVACVGPGVAGSGSGSNLVTVGLTAPHGAADAADVSVLAGDVVRVADLLDAARQRRHRLARSRRLTILPNVACVAGAFTLGFTSLVAALVSNAGTLGAYWRSRRTLERDRRRLWARGRTRGMGAPS
jgi:hypothetical protein